MKKIHHIYEKKYDRLLHFIIVQCEIHFTIKFVCCKRQQIGVKMSSMKYPHERLASAIKTCPLTLDNPGNRRALDVGCGDGRHVKLLAECGYLVDGLDIRERSIAIAKENMKEYLQIYSKTNFICQNIMEYIPESLYDVIVAWKYFYAYNKTYEECELRVKNVSSLLKKGGYAFMQFATKEDEVYKEGIELYEKGSQVYRAERINLDGYVFYNKEELADMMTRCGFQISKIENTIMYKTYEKPKYEEGNEWWKNKTLDSITARFIVVAEKIS